MAETIYPEVNLTGWLAPPRAKVHYGDIAGQSGLPPEDVWLINPDTDKFDTPLDDRGLIDIPVLIQAVRDTVDEEYEWPSHLSVHHFYWQGRNYDSVFAGRHARKFRELPVHKGLVPRVFENWLHTVTLEPPVPDPEVMQRRVESWVVAEGLFKKMREYVQWEKMSRRRSQLIAQNPSILPAEFNGEDRIGKEVLQEILDRHFSGVSHYLERMERIEPEFRLIEPTEDKEELATTLGRLIVPRALRLVKTVAA